MYGLGDQFFTGAALPGNEHGGLVFGHLTYKIEDLGHGLASGDHVAIGILFLHIIEPGLEPQVFFL